MHRFACAHVVALVAVATAILFVSGCGGSGGEAPTTDGRLQVAITDQAGTYAELHIAIAEVRVVPAGDDASQANGLPLIATYDPPRDVEIISLQYQHELLGDAVIPAGSYNQVRLVLAENDPAVDPVNYLTLASDPGTKVPIDTPSGQTSGLKVLGKFGVAAGQLNAILLDFDPERAVVEAGGSGRYNFKPTGIRIIQVDELPDTFGGLFGDLQPDTAWPTAVLSVIPSGDTRPIAEGTVDETDGTFRVLVPAGAYTVRVSAEGHDPTDFGPFVVVENVDTDCGTLDLDAAP